MKVIDIKISIYFNIILNIIHYQKKNRCYKVFLILLLPFFCIHCICYDVYPINRPGSSRLLGNGCVVEMSSDIDELSPKEDPVTQPRHRPIELSEGFYTRRQISQNEQDTRCCPKRVFHGMLGGFACGFIIASIGSYFLYNYLKTQTTSNSSNITGLFAVDTIFVCGLIGAGVGLLFEKVLCKKETEDEIPISTGRRRYKDVPDGPTGGTSDNKRQVIVAQQKQLGDNGGSPASLQWTPSLEELLEHGLLSQEVLESFFPSDKNDSSKDDNICNLLGSTDNLPLIQVHHNRPPTSEFIPGYTYSGQRNSLHSMQQILQGSSEQVWNMLMLLALKVHESAPQSIPTPTGYKKRLYGPSTLLKKPQTVKYDTILSSFRPFASIHGYTSNLEQKLFKSSIGVIVDLVSNVAFGFAYNFDKEHAKEVGGISFGPVSGSVKSRARLEGCSTIMAFNPYKKGVSGHLSGYYGWGSIKNVRSFLHANKEESSKGKASSHITGVLAQLGYNIPITKLWLLTPYVEYMTSIIRWSPYQEHTGVLPSKISSNKEQAWEKAIGLRSRIHMPDYSTLQLWFSASIGKNKVHSLTSRPAIASTWKYDTYVPALIKQYTRAMAGIAYHKDFMDDLDFGFHAWTCLEKEKQGNQQATMTCYLRYSF